MARGKLNLRINRRGRIVITLPGGQKCHLKPAEFREQYPLLNEPTDIDRAITAEQALQRGRTRRPASTAS